MEDGADDRSRADAAAHHSRRRLLGGLAGGAGLLALAAGAGGVRLAAAGDDDRSDGGNSGHGGGGGNSGRGGGNRGPGGGDAGAVAGAAVAAGPGQVQIVGRSFQPATITVDAGQTITWINADGDTHTATGAGFDTGPIPPGGSATATFATPGTFPYRCNFHPEMQGTVVAADAAGNAPPAAEAGASTNGAAPPPTGPGEAAVAIVDFAFAPTALRVPAGTTVVWTNTGSASHTVTGPFADSGPLASGATFRHTFAAEGAFDYACAFHPQMVGQIEVGPAASAAVAADATPAAAARSPALPGTGPAGTWLVELTPEGDAALPPLRALVTFRADGTLDADFAATGSAAGGAGSEVGPGHGSWEETAGGVDATVVALLLDGEWRFAGTLILGVSGQLDPTAGAYAGQFTFQATDAGGSTAANGAGAFRGSRLPTEPGGTLPAATPAESGVVAASEAVTVTVRDFAFEPAEIDVPLGATVTWSNGGQAPHTATADDGTFDTGPIDPGRSESVTFDRPGAHPYRCAFHPNMTGTVVVA